MAKRKRRRPPVSEGRKAKMVSEAFERVKRGEMSVAEYDRMLKRIREA